MKRALKENSIENVPKKDIANPYQKYSKNYPILLKMMCRGCTKLVSVILLINQTLQNAKFVAAETLQ